MIAGAVLAAGEGRRFGAVKQLAPFQARPLIERPLAALLGAGLDATFVVLGARADEVRAGADLGGARVVVCEDWADGMSRSLAAAVDAAEAAGADALVVVLGDQPLLDAEAVRRVVGSPRDGLVAIRATYAGRPGHPVLLERAIWSELRELRGDRGAADVLRGRPVADVACDGAGSDADADSLETLARLEREHP